MAKDISLQTSGIALPKSVMDEIWGIVHTESAIMKLARRVDLPCSGQDIQVVTSKPIAQLVGEANEKPVSIPGFATKPMRPYKIAVIVPFSDEFRRCRDKLYREIIRLLPSAIAEKADRLAFGIDASPGTGFDQLGGAAAISLATNVYGGFVSAIGAVAAAGGNLNGWALSPQAEGKVLGALDSSNRPIFIDNVKTEGAVGSILGRPVDYTDAAFKTGTPPTIGFGGDWTNAVWGMVDDIEIKFTDTATLTYGGENINLWQRNMSAVMAEVEFGFVLDSITKFVRFTG